MWYAEGWQVENVQRLRCLLRAGSKSWLEIVVPEWLQRETVERKMKMSKRHSSEVWYTKFSLSHKDGELLHPTCSIPHPPPLCCLSRKDCWVFFCLSMNMADMLSQWVTAEYVPRSLGLYLTNHSWHTLSEPCLMYLSWGLCRNVLYQAQVEWLILHMKGAW